MKKKLFIFSAPLISGTFLLFSFCMALPAWSAPGRALELVFAAADTNHDNLISVQEYHQAMQKRFEQLDLNRDGNLSRQEMENMRAAARQRLQALRGNTLSR